jgi:hypothetical protein
MSISLSQLLEESFQIAWEYLERTGELGDAAAASRFLSDTIEAMIRRGQRSRLAWDNIFRHVLNAGTFPVAPVVMRRPEGLSTAHTGWPCLVPCD